MKQFKTYAIWIQDQKVMQCFVKGGGGGGFDENVKSQLFLYFK